MDKKFIAGQMFELTQLLATCLSIDVKQPERGVVQQYIVKRLDVLNEEYKTVTPSVRRISRGENRK